MLDLVRKVVLAPAISGREDAVAEVIRTRMEPLCDEITRDKLGNLICLKRGSAPDGERRKIMFAAHMDEVGGIITGITDDGYLRFTTVGGILPDVLFARRVTINGHTGVIGGKAIHQCKGDAKMEMPSVDNMLIDIGADCEKEARTVAKEGDVFTFVDEQFSLSNGYFASKALDDRVGCSLLLSLAKTQPKYDIILAFTVQEEIGTRGAATAAFAIQPEIAVVIDATTAADVAGTPPQKQVCQTKRGAVVSYMDRATLYDTALYTHIRAVAESCGIAAQTKTTVAGGNDAGAIQRAGIGSRVAAVSLPCRYIHSPLCVLNEQDIQSTYALLEKLMNTLPAWDENT
jgi:endoglucanase